jgi:signal transduction histidine kinase
MSKEYFKISSGLKNIIGRDLITDDFIAVFELVKNSFDALANKVIVRFENITTPQKAKIIITDNGKGMDFDDIKNKWLFVAYSAKKEGIEDYRDKIKVKRHYAGAKGIGRFSCDRLGGTLALKTVRNTSISKLEIINVDWNEFELDAKTEFTRVEVKHTTDDKNNFLFKHGTSLEISLLNSTWDREKILNLKVALSKLIIPTIGTEKSNIEFEVQIECPEELPRDKEQIEKNRNEPDFKKIVNGPVKNFVFEKLSIKTTQIHAHISEDGKTLKTTLIDRGILVYEITEHNQYRHLKHIDYILFFLNRSAKVNFTKMMGIEPVNYGNVFVYKNGFRVQPYGNDRDDLLGIDARKTQGHSRYLGTRELIGRVEISGENVDLKETSSRDGGLIKTEAFHEMIDCLFRILRRLEKYVVEIKDWGVDGDFVISDDDNLTKEQIVKLMSNLSADKQLIDIKYNNKILDIVGNQEEKSANKLIKNFKRIGHETNNPDLIKKATQLEKKLNTLQAAKREAENSEEQKSKELKQIIGQNLFLNSVSTQDKKELISLQHHIDHASQRIAKNIRNLKRGIEQNASKKELQQYLEIINLENSKISSLARFVTKANFNLMSNTITKNLVEFISEYLHNVYSEYADLKANNELLTVRLVNEKNISFTTKFIPLEIIILLDNLLNNASKAKAKKMDVVFSKSNSSLNVSFIDNGKGISNLHAPKVFDFGYTTTSGSGLGLYHVKEIMGRNGGVIELNNKRKEGTEFILTFKKQL